MCVNVNRISCHKNLCFGSWKALFMNEKTQTNELLNWKHEQFKICLPDWPRDAKFCSETLRGKICHLPYFNHEYSLFSSFYWTCWRCSWAISADTYWCSLSLLLAIVFSHFSTLRTNLQVCQSHFALQIICSFITVISKDIWKRWIYERLSCILRRPRISMTL